MSDLHQSNVYIYISFRGYRCRDRIIVLFISLYKARNKSSEEYLQIATFYSTELNREAALTGDYLTGGVSIINPSDESDEAMLTFNKIQCAFIYI
jgi:hypothetical protein